MERCSKVRFSSSNLAWEFKLFSQWPSQYKLRTHAKSSMNWSSIEDNHTSTYMYAVKSHKLNASMNWISLCRPTLHASMSARHLLNHDISFNMSTPFFCLISFFILLLSIRSIAYNLGRKNDFYDSKIKNCLHVGWKSLGIKELFVRHKVHCRCRTHEAYMYNCKFTLWHRVLAHDTSEQFHAQICILKNASIRKVGALFQLP